jgi:hypothetical protein
MASDSIRSVSSRWWRACVGPVVVTGLILSACSVWSLWRFGGLWYGLRYFAGERLIVLSPRLDLGDVVVGKRITAQFVVKNLSGTSIDVYGADTDCGCLESAGLPVTIPPLAEVGIPFTMTPTSAQRGQPFFQHAILHLNVDHPELKLSLQGAVIADGS